MPTAFWARNVPRPPALAIALRTRPMSSLSTTEATGSVPVLAAAPLPPCTAGMTSPYRAAEQRGRITSDRWSRAAAPDEAAETAITNLARDLLSNPVIEEFTLYAG